MYVRPNEPNQHTFWVHKAGPGRDKAMIMYTVENNTVV